MPAPSCDGARLHARRISPSTIIVIPERLNFSFALGLPPGLTQMLPKGCIVSDHRWLWGPLLSHRFAEKRPPVDCHRKTAPVDGRAARRGKLDLERNTFTPTTAKPAIVGDPDTADAIVLAMTSSAQLRLSQTAESATLGLGTNFDCTTFSRRGTRVGS